MRGEAATRGKEKNGDANKADAPTHTIPGP